ncbi:hypothetical protein TeGR_g266 [Tetraparma gracilis]|uniref:Proteasome assembly chaperone 3 n=1 Tax=Tetraparma gracilis TaxID=2962635 RepID=A0ABQ6NCG6_9STRA|nr:hypothetical protein TeGR_g266 [Tetraparma gracilis]
MSAFPPPPLLLLPLSVPLPSPPSLPPLSAPVSLTIHSLSQAVIHIGLPSAAAAPPRLHPAGGLVAAFPPAFGAAAVSTLVGAGDDATASNMAARIAKRTGWPIFLGIASVAALAELNDGDEGLAIAKIEKAVVEAIEGAKGGGRGEAELSVEKLSVAA